MAKRSIYLPKPKKLLASLRLRSREFLRENTLHGFPYFVNPRRPLWERIAWFIMTVSSICAAIGIMWSIYVTFQAEPTLTGLDTETEELKTYFPSIAMCPIRPNLTREGVHPDDVKHYDFMYNWYLQPITNQPHDKSLITEDYSLFFFSYLPECGYLYTDCVVGRKKTDCQTFFRKQITIRGICCISEQLPLTKDEGVRIVTFETKPELAYPMSLYLLDNWEKPAHRGGEVTYVIKTGMILKISIQVTSSTPGVFSLSRKQRRCNSYKDDPSYSMCYHRCQRKHLLKKCGCLPWYMIFGSETVECKLPQYECIAQNATAPPDCKCYLGCNHTTYNVDSVQLNKDNRRITISIPNWPVVTYRREIRFSWLDILASFGGIAGLFVGYSLLTSVELAYYLVLRTYCGAVIEGPADAVRIEVKKRPQRRVIRVIDMKKDYHNYVE